MVPLAIEHLHVEYVMKRTQAPLVALDDLSLRVQPGELVAIVGPSGCGKTTLLHAAAGLTPFQRGRITIDGQPVLGPGQSCGMVFQSPALLPWRTVLGNVAYGLELRGHTGQAARTIAQDCLTLVGLHDFRESYPHELSGGMQQRVNLARALAVRPRVLLFDEPLAAEQPCFVYRDSRDLTGFIDGTANPEPLDAPNVALIPPGEPGEGGSHVMAIRWIHDLDAFHAQTVADQERVFGRTKLNSEQFPPDQMPANAHIARVQVIEGGAELEIYRRSVPYGTVAENGLYFVAFSADRTRFDRMLARVFGTAEDGVRDHLTDFSRAVSGAFYFAPSLTTLRELGVGEI